MTRNPLFCTIFRMDKKTISLVLSPRIHAALTAEAHTYGVNPNEFLRTLLLTRYADLSTPILAEDTSEPTPAVSKPDTSQLPMETPEEGTETVTHEDYQGEEESEHSDQNPGWV